MLMMAIFTTSIWQKRKERCDAAFNPVLKLQQDIKGKGYPEPVIVAGGSPTFTIHAKREM
jgi:hypothetical protein